MHLIENICSVRLKILVFFFSRLSHNTTRCVLSCKILTMHLSVSIIFFVFDLILILYYYHFSVKSFL